LIVVDASVVATALADDGPDGDRGRARLRNERLVAPSLLDLEVLSVWRRLVLAGVLDDRRADLAVTDLGELRLERVPHLPLLTRVWALRSNLTTYDAAYVAVAALLARPLVTADRRLAAAPDLPCEVELLG
jgi:predicted nucleic acid-binding protein